MVKPLDVVLCWHFHQPEYREPLSAQYQQSWTYLHAIKDYVDMAGHLEAHPDAKVVVNFSPLLLEQIDDYVTQITQYEANQSALRDPLLAALVSPVLSIRDDQKKSIIRQCLRANQKNLVERFPHYQRLVEIANSAVSARSQGLAHVSDRFVSDLVVWYHLAWIAETERKQEVVVRLSNKGSEFNLSDRFELFGLISESLRRLLPRYHSLSARGQVELSTTPYSHPILPLLLNIDSAQQASPDLSLPPNRPFCGGTQRAIWQLSRALSVFEKFFGFKPKGCWPSEGAICEQSLKLIEDAGYEWTASGANVLKNSLGNSFASDAQRLYRSYHLGQQHLNCFFRDDHLSDLIGFTYSNWHAEDAVNNLISELEKCQTRLDDDAIVAIILDGENAWEYYPRNGYYFLDELYCKFTASKSINLITFSDACAKPPARLEHVVAGSWVHGTLTTWVGDEQKNHAWDMLCEAKRVYDKKWPELNLADQVKAEQQLAICEGSDWFWWFGDYNPSEAVEQFDALFRMHLSHLYRCLYVTPPDNLALRFAHGCGSPEHGGVMRHGEI